MGEGKGGVSREELRGTLVRVGEECLGVTNAHTRVQTPLWIPVACMVNVFI